MKYAYLDSAEILHITKFYKTAQRCVKKLKDENDNIIKIWPITETDFPAKAGYPVDGDGNAYVLYSEIEEKHGREIPAELAELYIKVK